MPRATLADLAARVAALEAALSRPAPAAPAPAGGRVSKRVAATMLSCSVRSVSRYASRGLLVPLPRGVGRTTYFDLENVRALAESEAAAEEWVARRKYVPKRGR